jgi:DNA-binding YbaB/EbfC family protein
MGSGFSKMKKQARAFEQQMQQLRSEMQSKSIEGTSGNGLVTVIINGEKEIKEIKIKPDCVDPKDVEGLQDLILAALHDAYKKAGDEQQEMGGMNLPF